MATYLTLEQVRQQLGGVAKSTFAEWRADGRFPTISSKQLPNGRVLISQSDFDAFVDGLASA